MRLLDEETRLNPAEQRTLLDTVQHPDGVEAKFDSRLTQSEMGRLEATGIGVFQINVGKLCNQTCIHCHVDAGPLRSEVMTRETAELCMQVLASTEIPTVDITGGAPEMCPLVRVPGSRVTGAGASRYRSLQPDDPDRAALLTSA